MDDLFKKFINTGVGFVSQGHKAMQSAIEKLVKESKISEQEGKKIVDDLLKSSEAKRTGFEKQLKDLTKDLQNRVSSSPAAKHPPTPPARAKAAAKPAGMAKKTAAKGSAAKAGAARKTAAPPPDADPQAAA